MDRDFERFSRPALEALRELFLGKTGIFDHDPKAGNQTARIYRTRVEENPSKTTSAGEPYCMLKADAYMLQGEKQKELIAEIEAGIKKEVSIGCSVRSAVCSVCGKDMRRGECSHQKGRVYQTGGKKQICHAILCEPTDAYEWSFVAVPAQKNAGVYKHYQPQSHDKEGVFMQDIIKSLKQAGGPITLSLEDASVLSEQIRELQALAQAGQEYRKSLKREILGLSAQAQSELDAKVLGGILDKLEIPELREVKGSLERRVQKSAGIISQIAGAPGKDTQDNQFFKL